MLIRAFLLLFLLFAPAAASAQDVRFDLDTLRVGIAGRSRAAVAASTRTIEVLDRSQIANVPAVTVAEILARALGVDVSTRSAAQADIGIRGSSFEQVLIMVDGVPVSDDQTGHFDLDLAVPLSDIDRIEILRGTGSALYGADAVGGVINIVTGTSNAPRMRVEAGSRGTALVDGAGGFTAGRATVRGSGSVTRSDGHRQGTDYRFIQGRASASVPAGGGVIVGDVGWAGRDFGAADFYGPYPSYEETRTLTATLHWKDNAERKFALRPRVSFRRHDDDFVLIRDDPAVYQNVHRNTTASGELVAVFGAARFIDVAGGISFDRSGLDSERLGDRSETRGSLFAEITAGRADAIAIIGGVRADEHSTYGSFVSPSAAITWAVSRRLRLRASADRGFRAPTWTERFYVDPANIGNAELVPERFWSAETGLVFGIARNATVDAAAFFRHADQLIDWTKDEDAQPGVPWRTTNIESATFRGIELQARITSGGGVEWNARAAALSFSDDEPGGITSKYALRPLTRTGSVDVRVPVGRSGLSIGGRLAGARRHDEDGYLLADARISYARGRWTTYADATNLGDADYLDAAARPAAGRAFRIGARIGS